MLLFESCHHVMKCSSILFLAGRVIGVQGFLPVNTTDEGSFWVRQRFFLASHVEVGRVAPHDGGRCPVAII